jgi:hypothetical protein
VLTEISLLGSFQELGPGVFAGCTELQAIRVIGDPGVFANGAFAGCDAERLYTEMAEKYPATWRMKGIMYHNQGEYTEALEALVFMQRVELLPENRQHFIKSIRFYPVQPLKKNIPGIPCLLSPAHLAIMSFPGLLNRSIEIII